MKVYIVRHGQTKCNVENKYNCRLDEDINEQKALQKLKEKYHDQGIILNEENYV